jgi:hypothetical protein
MVRDLNISINLHYPRISFPYTCFQPVRLGKCSIVVLVFVIVIDLVIAIVSEPLETPLAPSGHTCQTGATFLPTIPRLDGWNARNRLRLRARARARKAAGNGTFLRNTKCLYFAELRLHFLRPGSNGNFNLFKYSALPTTVNELAAIAASAASGCSNPNTASGMASRL